MSDDREKYYFKKYEAEISKLNAIIDVAYRYYERLDAIEFARHGAVLWECEADRDMRREMTAIKKARANDGLQS